ncbi:DUF3560 domain-containing protein [Streptomyces sp. H27-H1]|uniref:DUF3560 domain-containing protein n=1 Tax=unclassified Streptomyces TaxID=2593676 RepID=UPI00227066AC|nr:MULTISPECIES: DUF3560 domain-containing protein [unclassified Streptomyces]MCY0931159.1 DUF3560 domain-containing protein [Streptomyces sp. H27-H1]MCY0939246.1 DUF3560 domain-containing protein [Streptomyces sp. H34-S4]
MTITIKHTRREGTLVKGAARGDGSGDILKRRVYGWSARPYKFSRNLACWYFPHSRDKQADMKAINQLAANLRAGGFTVEVVVDEDDRRTFAEAEADRVERAEDRAARFAGYADSAATNADALHTKARSMSSRIPFGQPVQPPGHHSVNADVRFRERIHDTFGKSIREDDRAAHWSNREDAAANYERYRNNPPRTLRRIEKLEVDLRHWDRVLNGEAGGWNLEDPEEAAEVRRRRAEVVEELGEWRKITAAEKEGFKVWSKDDFKRGDYVRCRGHWYEVLRVNPKSVTVPSILNVHQEVVTKENSTFGDMTHTLKYDGVAGRKSPEEMAEHLAKPVS